VSVTLVSGTPRLSADWSASGTWKTQTRRRAGFAISTFTQGSASISSTQVCVTGVGCVPLPNFD
jgi:hypothetical protein